MHQRAACPHELSHGHALPRPCLQSRQQLSAPAHTHAHGRVPDSWTTPMLPQPSSRSPTYPRASETQATHAATQHQLPFITNHHAPTSFSKHATAPSCSPTPPTSMVFLPWPCFHAVSRSTRHSRTSPVWSFLSRSNQPGRLTPTTV